MLVTERAETVTNIFKMSPTHFVSNIRHQHRCSPKFLMENKEMVWLSIIRILKIVFSSVPSLYILKLFQNQWCSETKMPCVTSNDLVVWPCFVERTNESFRLSSEHFHFDPNWLLSCLSSLRTEHLCEHKSKSSVHGLIPYDWQPVRLHFNRFPGHLKQLFLLEMLESRILLCNRFIWK